MKNGAQSCGWSIVAAGLVVIFVLGWLGIEGQRGYLNSEDEYLTAERAREMRILGPWAVHSNFRVIGVKPPLQYWLTGLTLPCFQSRELAIRIWPLVYAALAAAALAWLAFLVDPSRPWLMPLSVALFLSCPVFLRETSRAQLDSGLTFFATIAIAFAELARRRPVWWLAVAAACWLGALQKVPLVLLIWLILMVIRLISPGEREKLRSGWLLGAVIGAILLMAIWPMIQWFEFHLDLRELFRVYEITDIAQRLVARAYLTVLASLTTVWPCGVFALAAMILVPRIAKNGVRTAAAELSWLSGTFIVLTIASNLRSVRYLLPILPTLCLLLAMALAWTLERRQAVYRFAFGFVSFLAVIGFLITQLIINHRRLDQSNEIRLAQQLGMLQRAGQQLVMIEADHGLLCAEFYLFYGNINARLTNFSVAQLRQSPPTRPLLGICNGRDLPAVQEQFPDLQIRLTLPDLFCWEVKATSP